MTITNNELQSVLVYSMEQARDGIEVLNFGRQDVTLSSDEQLARVKVLVEDSDTLADGDYLLVNKVDMQTAVDKLLKLADSGTFDNELATSIKDIVSKLQA